MAEEQNQDQNEEQESGQDQEQGEEKAEEKLNCSISVDDIETCKKKIKIVIPRAEIDKELDKQYSEMRWSAEVPGFRKGRAPRRLLEKRFGDELSRQTKLKLMAQAFEQIDEEQDFDVLGEPDFDPANIELPDDGDLTFEYDVEIKPKFELPSLEGIRIEKPLFEITDERIEQAIADLQRRYGKIEELTDEAAVDDDVVTADVSMKVEGSDNDEPETLENHPVRVGKAALMGVMIEDMGKTLGGAKIGDTKKCTAVVPDTHEKEDYRDKKAEFTIEVKGIRRMVPAELNAEFFEQLGINDESELRQHLEDGLEKEADREIRNLMAQQVYDHLDKAVEFELPADLAARHADRFLQRRYYELLQQGVPAEQMTENLEQLRASSSEQANKQFKMSFVMEEVADNLGIEVDSAEINGVVAQIAARYGRRPEKVREEMQKEGRLESLANQLRDEKAIDKILESAEVVDAPVAEKNAEAEKPKAKKKTKKKAAAKKVDKDEKADKTEKTEDESAEKKTAKKTTKKTPRKAVKRKAPEADE